MCPKCGSKNFQDFLAFNEQLKIREGIEIRQGDKKTGLKYKQISRQELGRDGKEAKNTMIFNVEKDRYTQSVRKQDEKGVWKECHKDDESLTEHNRKAREKSKKL